VEAPAQEGAVARPSREGATRGGAFVVVSHTRVRILELVGLRPRTVCEIARTLDINKSAVHKHLQRLVLERALVRSEAGKWVYYKHGPAAGELLLQVTSATEEAVMEP
jgi:DNA-binding transcriptional ArsR family regulator